MMSAMPPTATELLCRHDPPLWATCGSHANDRMLIAPGCVIGGGPSSVGNQAFGARAPGAVYVDRPGAYGVAAAGERIAVVKTKAGRLFLPGGALQAGETNEDALAREVLEECGWAVQILGEIGRATQFVFVPGEGHFAIRAIYFRMALSRRRAEHSEHELVWFPATEALSRLARESDVWAVSTSLSPDCQFNE